MEKICGRCRESKPLDAFYRASRGKLGRQAWCKVCDAERTRDWSSINEGRYDAKAHHARSIAHKYGLTVGEYEKMLAEQGHVCAICERACGRHARLSVDHDHATGKVRGLLCNSCNTALGSFQDNPVLLTRAITYLRGS